MRDCALLPIEMVKEVDVDLLPSKARYDFELKLYHAMGDIGKLADRVHSPQSTPTRPYKKAPSLLSLQGLGEALFGATPSSDESDSSSQIQICRADIFRWDTGYEELELSASVSGNDRKTLMSGGESNEQMSSVKAAMKNLR
jgi:hypothetical protein